MASLKADNSKIHEVAFDFDVDRYVNRCIPRSCLHLFPKPIAHFLGYRSSPLPRLGSVLVWWWAFIGGFCGILIVEAVFHTRALQAEGTPIIIASLGASAILEYHVIDSPLSQPRNAILGQIFSATIGIGITKLFQISPHFESLRWIAGALSVGLASAFMGFTKTIHPPAGATALLCSTTPAITDMGWFMLPLTLLGSTLIVSVACVLNNIQRQFPICWWTPADLSWPKKADLEEASDKENQVDNGDKLWKSDSDMDPVGDEGRILIDGERIVVPEWFFLDYEEKAMLEILHTKLREGLRATSL